MISKHVVPFIMKIIKIYVLLLCALMPYYAQTMKSKNLTTSYTPEYTLPPSPPPPPIYAATQATTDSSTVHSTTQTTPELLPDTTTQNVAEIQISNSSSSTELNSAIASNINTQSPQLGYENNMWHVSDTTHNQFLLSETQMLHVLTSLPPTSIAQVQNGSVTPIFTYLQQYPNVVQMQLQLSSIPAETKASALLHGQNIMRILRSRYNTANKVRQHEVITTKYSLSYLCRLYAQKNIHALECVKYAMENTWPLTPDSRRAFSQFIGQADAMITSLQQRRAQEQIRFHQLVTDQSQIITKHQNGDKNGLREEIRRLQSEARQDSSAMQLRQLHTAIKRIEERINDVTTESLRLIRTADLATAKAEYEKIKDIYKHKPTTMKYKGAIKQDSSLSRTYFGFDPEIIAKNALESRSDYQKECAAATTICTGPGMTTTTHSIGTDHIQAMVSTDRNQNIILSTDTTPIIMAGSVDATEFEEFAYDLVTTVPTRDLMGQQIQIQLRDLQTEIATTPNPNDPALHARVIEKICDILQELYSHEQAKLQQDMCNTQSFLKGFLYRITDLKGMAKDNINFCSNVLTLCVNVLTVKKKHYRDFIDNPPAKSRIGEFSNKLASVLTKENASKLYATLAQIPQEEWYHKAGEFLADYVAFSAVQRGVSSTGTLIRNVTQLHTEGKLVQAIENTAQSVAQKAKNIAGPGQEAVAMTTEGISVRMAPGAQETMSFQDVLQKVGGATQKAEGLLVSVAEQAIIKKLTDSFVTAVWQDIPRLRQLFDGKFKGFGTFANKFLKFDYEHILGMAPNFTRRGMPDIKGFHHDFMGAIEKSGVFEFANKKLIGEGFCKAELFYNGNKVKDLTLFPSHWNREKVLEKIVEACENFARNNGVLAEGKGGKFFLEAKTNEGIEIAMYITRNGEILTAYPTMRNF